MSKFIEVHNVDDSCVLLNVDTICEICSITNKDIEVANSITDDSNIGLLLALSNLETKSKISELMDNMKNAKCMITLTIRDEENKTKSIFTKETYDELKVLILNSNSFSI